MQSCGPVEVSHGKIRVRHKWSSQLARDHQPFSLPFGLQNLPSSFYNFKLNNYVKNESSKLHFARVAL
jgi:hypothetical protein